MIGVAYLHDGPAREVIVERELNALLNRARVASKHMAVTDASLICDGLLFVGVENKVLQLTIHSTQRFRWRPGADLIGYAVVQCRHPAMQSRIEFEAQLT